MTRMIVKSKVGADGVLHLDVPLGVGDANAEVQVIIEPMPTPPAGMSHADYMDWLARTIGTWQGPFERPEQGEFEKRDEF